MDKDRFNTGIKQFIVALAILILSELNVLPSYIGGFYCNDPKLSHKFEGDTVSIMGYLIICAVTPFIIMLVIELLLYQPEKYSFSDIKYRNATFNSLIWYGEYFLGYIFNLTFMDVVKFSIGEPRPHFFDTCKPDSLATCISGEYVSSYNCTNTQVSSHFLRDSVKSFPSGHSSISIYMAVFLYFYLKQRSCKLKYANLGTFLQTSVFIWSAVCSLTRISDHRHHWWDVLGGAVLGISLAYYCVFMLCKKFTQPAKLDVGKLDLNSSEFQTNGKSNKLKNM